MKILESDLRKIVRCELRESYLSEVSASEVIFGEPAGPSGTLGDRERNRDYFTDKERNVGLLKKLAEMIQEAAMSPAGGMLPWGLEAFLWFLGLRESEMNITGKKYIEAMYWVAKSAKARGSSEINYEDYQRGQKAAGIKDTAPTHASSNRSGPSAILSFNPYTAMSIVIGQAPVRGSRGSGYLIRDRYNFDLNREPGTRHKVEQYIFSIPNARALIERIIGGKVGGGATGWLEELMVMYEATFKYYGYKFKIQTPSKDKVED